MPEVLRMLLHTTDYLWPTLRKYAMELKDNIPTFHAKTRAEWREWLALHHQTNASVWLIIYHKKSNIESIYYEAAVEEALCFGWIDSKGLKRDAESSYLYFAPRNPKSYWSKPNRERVESLMAEGLMTSAGIEMIKLAKRTGTWEALLDVENGVIPEDLQNALEANETAFQNFQKFPPSSKKMILQWIMSAKKSETRQKRIEETVNLAGENKRAHHP